MKKKKRIYLDYAASTPVFPEVVEAMAPYWREEYGNAGAIHAEGIAAKKVLLDARARIAALIGAHTDEIIFTSGGTESNNLAIFGLVETIGNSPAPSSGGRGKALPLLHFVTSAIEHPSVLDCFKALEGRGASVTYCGVLEHGLTDPKEVRDALRSDTVLISIALANNEIGTVEPISEIGKVVRAHNKQGGRIFFHTDASQAPLWIDCRVEKLGVDLATFDGQKMCGPKGVGFLFAKRGTPLAPIMHGGSQERGLRPGTSVIPLIVGMARALEIAQERREETTSRIAALRDYAIDKITKRIPNAVLNGHETERLANNINISFPGVDNEFLVLQLDAKGFAVGTRSACLSQENSGSYVIEALGKGRGHSKSSIRITLGPDTTQKDTSDLVETLVELIV